MRFEKVSCGLTRWDLFFEPNPNNVCAVCEKYVDHHCIIRNRATVYPNIYLCGEISINPQIRPFLKENPYKNYTREQFQALQKSIADQIDLTVFPECRKYYPTTDVDNIDLTKISVLKNSLKIFGTGIIKEPFHADKIETGYFSWELKHLEKGNIFVYKNGVSVRFQLDKFLDALHSKTLMQIMIDADINNTADLVKRGEL